MRSLLAKGSNPRAGIANRPTTARPQTRHEQSRNKESNQTNKKPPRLGPMQYSPATEEDRLTKLLSSPTPSSPASPLNPFSRSLSFEAPHTSHQTPSILPERGSWSLPTSLRGERGRSIEILNAIERSRSRSPSPAGRG